MLKGALWKCTSTFASGMERRFCVLVSSLMLEFESEDDFLCGSPPKAEAEIIGASAWKGKSRPRGAHKEGFVYVTRLGRTHYCCVTSAEELEDWMLWMRTALDMALGTQGVGMEDPHVAGVSISREALHRGVLEPSKPSESEVCSKSGAAFGLTQSRYNCCSCGGAFILDYCSRKVPLPHHGFEEAVRVCDDCLEAQQLLAHLRFLSCVLAAHLHQRKLTRRGERLAVVRSLGRKSEDDKKKNLCNSLEVGLSLLERGELSEEEFGGLVKAEERFQRDEAYNRVHAGCLSASARLGDSTLAVVGLLHRGAASAPADEFRAVVLHLRMLAERDLDSIDFFWPQVLHAFYLLVPTVTAEGVFKAELLEDFIMAMALRSTHLAVKLVWWLKGYVEDLAGETAANSGKGAAGKQAHLVRLAVEVEDMVLSRADHASARKRRRRRTHEKPFNASATQHEHQHQKLGQESGNAEATNSSSSSSGGGGEGGGKTPDHVKRGEGTLAGDVKEEDEEEEENDAEGPRSLPLERRLLATLVRPTGAQSSLVGDELLLLRALRAAAAEHLGLDYVAKKTLFYDAAWDPGCCDDGEGGDQGLTEARYFEEQLTFAQGLVDIAERLRFVEPVSSRGDRLKQELITLGDDDGGDDVTEGNDDVTTSNESNNQDQGGSSSCAAADGDVGSINRSGCNGSEDMTKKGREGNGDGGGEPREAVTEAEAGAGARAEMETGKGIPGDVEAEGKGGGKRVNSHRRRRGGGRGGCRATTAGGVRGYLPVCRATDPICPIVRIPPSEGHVFKTKQRAPTLVTCEIVVPRTAPAPAPMPASAGEGNIDKNTMLPAGPVEAENAMAEARRGSGGVAAALEGRRVGEGRDDTEGKEETVGSSGGGGGGRAGLMRSSPLRRMENLRASTASPLNLERRSLPGSGREEVEEMIGSQVEPQGSLARSISDREDPASPTESPHFRKPEIRQLLENSDPLLEAQRRPEGSAGGVAAAAAAAATPSESAVPMDVGAAVEASWGFQKNEAFVSDVVEEVAMVTEKQRSQRSQPRVTVGAIESQSQGSVDPTRVDAEIGAGGDGDGGGGDGDGNDKIPSLSSSKEAPAVPDEGSVGGVVVGGVSTGFSGGSTTTSSSANKIKIVGNNGRGGSSSSSGETFVAVDKQELQLVEPLDDIADVPGEPSPAGGTDKGVVLSEQQEQEQAKRKTSDVVEDALRLHRGHEMLRRCPLSKEPASHRSGVGGGGASDGSSGALGLGLGYGGGADSGGGADRGGEGGADDAASHDSRVKVGGGVSPDREEAFAPRVYFGVEGEEGLLEMEGRRKGGSDDEESVAVCRARALFDKGLISEEELEAVVRKDRAFTEVVEQHAFLDVQFCVSQAFGESWANKRARIKAASAWGDEPGWDLVSIIIKSNDDLRQEVCALQLIGLCKRIFEEAGLDLFLQPYVIVSTGSSSGLVQCLTDAISVDSLKKKPNFVSLRDHFEKTYGKPTSKRFLEAQRNFINSLAAYSLACYVLQIKDRHNGNILLDAEGRLIHIDFGFILGMAPGGNFALETCPFKLPTDYLEVMGGLESQGFMDLVVAFTCGFLTLQAHVGRFVKLLGMMTQKSPFPCFQGKDSPENIVKKLSDRLMPHLDKSETVAFCLDLIRESYNNYGQRQYDYYQWLTNGIVT